MIHNICLCVPFPSNKVRPHPSQGRPNLEAAALVAMIEVKGVLATCRAWLTRNTALQREGEEEKPLQADILNHARERERDGIQKYNLLYK